MSEIKVIKCDTCNSPAIYSVSGLYMAHNLCAACAASLCLSLNDQAGHDKFKAVSNGN